MAKRKAAKSGGDGAWETLKTAVWALAIALVIRTFLVQAFRIPSGSMEDTLLIGDFLLVDKITFGARVPGTPWRLPGFREPQRGDILVFKDPTTERDYIKRCIATEGETIAMIDNQVVIGGEPIAEPYKAVKPYPGPQRASFQPFVVPDRTLFMMGDNRNNSQDSRYWGPLDDKRVVGRAFVLYWSTDPDRAPAWVRRMPENWVKGFLQLFLGRPRLSRLGKWLAKDWTEAYAQGVTDLPPGAEPAGSVAPAPAAATGDE